MSGSLRKKSAASLEPTFSAHAVSTAKPKKSKRPPPLSLRLSEDERAELERLASGGSLGGYIRERLFDNSDSLKQPRTHKPPIKDYQLLARVLRALANADTIKSIGNLDAACDHSSPMSTELQITIQQACADIATMRHDLVAALGLRSECE